jgi:hypothetical protein
MAAGCMTPRLAEGIPNLLCTSAMECMSLAYSLSFDKDKRLATAAGPLIMHLAVRTR